VFAPSHPQIYPFGYLVTNSKFTSDANKNAESALIEKGKIRELKAKHTQKI
jgi:pectin methylesterase-like acyl-CoA thioesterase